MTRSRLDMPERSVLAARERLVLDHFRHEVDQDWDATLSTFPHPYYELVATLTVHEGERDVRRYYADTRVAFPDQHHEIIELRHSHDAVIVEFWLMGTHRGPLGPIPATGGTFRVRMTAFFQFDEEETLVAERIYFDSLTMLKQLLGALNLRDPRSLPKVVRALKGLLTMTREPDPRLLATTPPGDLAH